MNSSIFDRKKKRKEARTQKKLQKERYYKRLSHSSKEDNLVNIQINSHQKDAESKNNNNNNNQIKKKPITKQKIKEKNLKKNSTKELKPISENYAKNIKKKKEINNLNVPLNEDDELINYYSKKLGMKEEKGLKKFHKEIIQKDGLDEDLFSFLDKIDRDFVKELDEYQPREQSDIDEEENYEESIASSTFNQEESVNSEGGYLSQNLEKNEEMDEEEDQEFPDDNIQNENNDNLDEEEIDSDDVVLDYEPKRRIIGSKLEKKKKKEPENFNEENLKSRKLKKKEENQNIVTSPIEKDSKNQKDLYGFDSKNNNDTKTEMKPMTFTQMLAARKANIIKDNTEDEIIKTVQSNLNKLSEGNIENIFQKFLELFSTHSKFVLISVFSDVFMKNTINNFRALPFILSCQCCIYGALYQFLDNDFIGEIIKLIILKFKSVFEGYESYKKNQNSDEYEEFGTLKNISQVFSLLYLFEVLQVNFIFDYLAYLLENLDQQILDLIMITIQNTGNRLRRENPKFLKQFIDKVKETIKPELTNTKTNLLLEILNDLKLNKNIRNDPTQSLEFLNNWLKRGVILKRKMVQKSFPLSFKEALICDFTKKNWWIQNLEESLAPVESEKNFLPANPQNILLEKKAKEQRFSSELRRQIFITIMNAEDFADASQSLFKMKPNKQQIRDIAVVIVECAAQEETYNPFYGFLAKQLIEVRKEMKFCFQYALWDQFKGLESFTLRKICNIAKISAFFVENYCVGISLLKGLSYDDRIKQEVLFIKTFLKHLFQKKNAKEIKEVAEKVKNNEENAGFRDNLYNFVKKNVFLKMKDEEEKPEELEKIKAFLRGVKIDF